MRGANKVAIELGKTRRQGFPVAATDIGDVFQYRLFVFDFRRRDSRNRILRRCGGHFPQLIDKLLPGRVVLKHVGKCAVSGFFLFSVGFWRRILLGGGGSGGDAGNGYSK